jgi:hypothetical protein
MEKERFKNNFLLIVAILLIAFWVVGAFVVVLGKIIHLLLVFAVLAILIRVFRSRRIDKGK